MDILHSYLWNKTNTWITKMHLRTSISDGQWYHLLLIICYREGTILMEYLHTSIWRYETNQRELQDSYTRSVQVNLCCRIFRGYGPKMVMGNVWNRGLSSHFRQEQTKLKLIWSNTAKKEALSSEILLFCIKICL